VLLPVADVNGMLGWAGETDVAARPGLTHTCLVELCGTKSGASQEGWNRACGAPRGDSRGEHGSGPPAMAIG
jgi:hypothetical protein